ncbi:MAG: type II toxin-antitoxin system HicA family toxin [Dongiaceae bacterium]
MTKDQTCHHIVQELIDEGWNLVETTEIHDHFRHPAKRGAITIPHLKRNLPPVIIKSIRMRMKHP